MALPSAESLHRYVPPAHAPPLRISIAIRSRVSPSKEQGVIPKLFFIVMVTPRIQWFFNF